MLGTIRDKHFHVRVVIHHHISKVTEDRSDNGVNTSDIDALRLFSTIAAMLAPVGMQRLGRNMMGG